MKTAPVVALLVVGSFFAGALVRGCQRNAEADEAIREAERWKDSTAVRDSVIAAMDDSVAVLDSIAADSVALARRDATAAERDARVARTQAAQVVAQLDELVSDTARVLLGRLDSLNRERSEAQERETAACRLELRQCEAQVEARDARWETVAPAFASRDSTIAAQGRAIDALRRRGLSLFGVPICGTVGLGATAGAGGYAVGPSATIGLCVGG